MTIIDMRVHMDCSGCEKQVRKALLNLEGVDDVIIDMNMQKVTVMGWAKQKKVLKTARQNGRTAELWPYPYNSEHHNFIYHYQLGQHQNQNQNYHQSSPKPLATYNSISSSSSSSSLKKYKKKDYGGGRGDSYKSSTDYGWYQEAAFASPINEKVGAMFSDENPHACFIM